MGGDQIYTDHLWTALTSVREWATLSSDDRAKAPCTKEMYQQLHSYIFDVYCNRWRNPVMREMFARVPSLMMWDDHDIIDGYGSRFRNRLLAGIYEVARENFICFQLHAFPSSSSSNFISFNMSVPDDFVTPLSFWRRISDVGILALDNRSERSEKMVMSDESYNILESFLMNEDNPFVGCSHLFLIVGILLFFADVNIFLNLFKVSPGRHDLEDDMIDHWDHPNHVKERKRFLMMILLFSQKFKIQITVLTGDVHCGAFGMLKMKFDDIEKPFIFIHQPISSGICAAPPPQMLLKGYDSVFSKRDEIVIENYSNNGYGNGYGNGEKIRLVIKMLLPHQNRDDIGDDDRYLDNSNFLILSPIHNNYNSNNNNNSNNTTAYHWNLVKVPPNTCTAQNTFLFQLPPTKEHHSRIPSFTDVEDHNKIFLSDKN